MSVTAWMAIVAAATMISFVLGWWAGEATEKTHRHPVLKAQFKLAPHSLAGVLYVLVEGEDGSRIWRRVDQGEDFATKKEE